MKHTIDFSAHVRDFDWFLARLDLEGSHVRGPEDIVCRCPAHDDYTPSLHIVVDDQGLLIHCFAGCTRGEVEEAIEDRVPAPSPKPKARSAALIRREQVAKYDYVNYLGEVVYRKVRFEPKSFEFQRPIAIPARTEGPVTWDERLAWARGLKDENGRLLVQPVPFNLHLLNHAKEVWIVDGEKDAAALTALGLGERRIGTCSPYGMATWPEERDEETPDPFFDPFLMKRLVIVADRDAPGYVAADSLAQRMAEVAASVRVVEAAEGKDAFDHFRAGYGFDDFVEVTVG